MFRFTIRDLLWLTLAVALAIGWGLRERRFHLRETEFLAERRHLRSEVTTARGTAWVIWQTYRELPGAPVMLPPYSTEDLAEYSDD